MFFFTSLHKIFLDATRRLWVMRKHDGLSLLPLLRIPTRRECWENIMQLTSIIKMVFNSSPYWEYPPDVSDEKTSCSWQASWKWSFTLAPTENTNQTLFLCRQPSTGSDFLDWNYSVTVFHKSVFNPVTFYYFLM